MNLAQIAQPILEQLKMDMPIPASAIAHSIASQNRISVSARTVSHVAQRLKQRGLIEVRGRSGYVLTEAGRVWLKSGRSLNNGEGKRNSNSHSPLRKAAWWLMREFRRFTINDLLDCIDCSEQKKPHENLSKYALALCRVGVLKKSTRRVANPDHPGVYSIIWILVRDLGPKTPFVRGRANDVVVIDPNSGDMLSVQDEVCEGKNE